MTVPHIQTFLFQYFIISSISDLENAFLFRSKHFLIRLYKTYHHTESRIATLYWSIDIDRLTDCLEKSVSADCVEVLEHTNVLLFIYDKGLRYNRSIISYTHWADTYIYPIGVVCWIQVCSTLANVSGIKSNHVKLHLLHGFQTKQCYLISTFKAHSHVVQLRVLAILQESSELSFPDQRGLR